MAWLLQAGEIAGAIVAITGALAIGYRRIYRPLRQTGAKALDILEQILDTAKFARTVASEMREFSGAFTMFAVGIKQQVDQHAERLERLEELPEMVIDLQADVTRIMREHR